MMIFAGMHGSYPNSQVAYGTIYVDFLLFSHCFSTDFGVLWGRLRCNLCRFSIVFRLFFDWFWCIVAHSQQQGRGEQHDFILTKWWSTISLMIFVLTKWWFYDISDGFILTKWCFYDISDDFILTKWWFYNVKVNNMTRELALQLAIRGVRVRFDIN